MPLTADQLQTRIDTLQAARDAGVLRVRHGVDYVDYKSSDDMDTTLARLKSQLATVNGTKSSNVNYIEQTSKGFGYGPGRRHW